MTRPRAAVAAAVLLLVAPAAAPALAAAAGPEPSTRAGSASFAADSFAEDRGDVARVEVHLSGTSLATVAVGAQNRSAGYRATVRLRDADGDGRVSLRVNTFLAGRSTGDAYAAAGDDGATLVAGTGGPGGNRSDGVLPAGRYALAVAGGTDAPALGAGSETTSGVPPDDEATLRLTAAGTDLLRVWAAPPGAAVDRTTADGLRRAMASDTLRRARYVRRESLVVVELGVSGLAGAFAAQPGPTTTARFGPALDAVGAGIGTTEGIEQPARLFGYRDGNWTVVDGVAVVPDPANDTYYLMVDLSAVPARAPGREWDLSNHTSVIVVYTVRDGGLLATGDDHPEHSFSEQHQERFSPTPRRAEVDTDRRHPTNRLVVPRSGNATVTGSTWVRPGRNLTVVVAAADGSFEARYPATVTFVDGEYLEADDEEPDHRFVARVDVSSLPVGTELRVDVRHRGRSLLVDRVDGDREPVPGVVARTGATVTDVRRSEVRRSDLYADVWLADGGFLVAHDGSVDGPVLAASSYLRGGVRADSGGGVHPAARLRVDGTVASGEVVLVAHRDADGNRAFDSGVDPPYRSNGTPAAASVPWDDGSPTPAGTSTGPDVPGLGVGAGLAAFAAAALALRRRAG